MTQPAIELFNRRALMLKLETTEGTDAAPVVGTDAFQIMDGKSQMEGDKKERNIDRPVLTASSFAWTNSRGTITGNIELVPPTTPGTTTAAVDALLQCGAMASTLDSSDKTTRYTPVSTGFKSATAYWNHAGTLRKVLGSRTDITGLMLGIDDYFKAQFNLQGFCDEVTEAALPTGLVYDAFREPVVISDANSQLLIGVASATPALHVWAKSLSIDFGLQLKTDRFTEHKQTTVSDRQGKFTLVMARPAKADFDPWALRQAGTAIAGAFRLSQASNLYSELGFRGQIDTISEDDTDGNYTLSISGPCIASDDGNDDYYVEFGDTTI